MLLDKYKDLNEDQRAIVDSTEQFAKDNITPNICYIAQLSQIPGISNKIATQISDKYNSIAILCQNYKENPGLLENFEYEINNDKKRKLGKKKNDTIFNFLFNKID